MPVYMLQAGAFGDIKIGVATDPLARMKQLQTSMPKKLRLVRVLDGGPAEEKAIHARFAANRLAGEWFRLKATEVAADLGLRDLPIPQKKRDSYYDPSTAEGRWHQLQSDLLEIVGGPESFARALGIMPYGLGLGAKHLSAAIVLARQAGAPIGYSEARAMMKAAAAIRGKNVRSAKRHQHRGWRRDFEQKWIARHGVSKAWWPLYPENVPVAEPAPETIASTEAA